MDQSISKHINYSQYFSQLIDKSGNINDTISTFLYYMFPRDLFIRALSLLESNDMIIYVLTLDKNTRVPKDSICSTFPDSRSVISTPTPIVDSSSSDKSDDSSETEVSLSPAKKSASVPPSKVMDTQGNNSAELQSLLYKLFHDTEQLLCRFIVKSQTDSGTSNDNNERPIFVDIENWMCSCDEFSSEFQKSIVAAHRDSEIKDSEKNFFKTTKYLHYRE